MMIIKCAVFASLILFNFQIFAYETGYHAMGGTEFDSNSPIAIAHLEGEPSAFIHNCVNVITGQFSETSTDLIVYHGVSPLTVERTCLGSGFNRGVLGGCWTLNHYSRITESTLLKSDKSKFNYDLEERGASIQFTGLLSGDKNKKNLKVAKSLLRKGIVNTSHGFISGQTNIKNWKLEKSHEDFTTLSMGSGMTRLYSNGSGLRLRQEVKPCGNKFHYSYIKNNKILNSIELFNRNGQTNGSSLHYDRMSSEIIKSQSIRRVKTGDGRWVNYKLEKKRGQNLLNAISRSDGFEEKYNYELFEEFIGESIYETYLMTERCRPDNRYLAIGHYSLNDNYVAGSRIRLKGHQDPRHFRVKELYAPAGFDSSRVKIYQFVYHLNVSEKKKHHRKELIAGCCDVYDAYMCRTCYFFDDNQRIYAINKHLPNNDHYTQERFYWGEENSPEHTCLLARVFEHVNNLVVFARTYQYDSFGNVTNDSLYGNLTGNNTIGPVLDSNASARENGCEHYSKKSTYSNDSFNLLLSETDGFSTTVYTYTPGTNLLESKFEGDDPSCRKRHFYTYDDHAALTLEVVDNGTGVDLADLTGVTLRYFTYYTQSQTYPVAYPIEIQNKYLDLSTGMEHLINRVVNTYNEVARITKQDHYDSTGNFAYSLFWEYDSMGCPIKEIDAIGRTTIRTFDVHGNCLTEQSPSGLKKKFLYDFMNRLIREEEIHEDGKSLFISNYYDLKNNRTTTIDPFGNVTNFKYDQFGRNIETFFPPVLDQNGQEYLPSTKREYDPMGNVIKEINAKGIEKNMRYTIRGQLTDTFFADGTSEYNRYQKNGFLAESKARNGTIIRYTNDANGRVIQTEMLSATRESLKTTYLTYDSFHKLTETDASGVVTSYSYYPNGQAKSIQKLNHFVEYFYDSLGNLVKTVTSYGDKPDEKIIDIKAYDLLGRVLYEATEDAFGNALTQSDFLYDMKGNIIQLKTNSSAGVAITSTIYDSYGTPSLVTDSMGNQTRTTLRYDYKNAFGQRVLQKTITDPLGNLTLIEMDALGKIRSTIRKNPFGTITQHHEQFYDATGNCCRIVEYVINPDGTTTPVTTLMEYDTTDHLIAMTEAYETQLQKTTKITYNTLISLKIIHM